MCDPVTAGLLIAGLVMSAVSIGVSAYSSNQQTKAANQAAQYNAEMSKRNQEVANLQAVDAQARGEIEEKQFRLNLSKQKGEMRAGYGASGAVVDTGSALDNLADTVEYGELDALTIRHNTAMEVWGLKNQAANYYGQSELFRTSKQSVGLNTGSTILSGTSSMLMSGASAYGGMKGSAAPKPAAAGVK